MWSIYTMEYYSAIRKNDYPTFAVTWVGLEEIIPSEISQAEKDNYHMVSLMWNINNSTEDHRGRKGNPKGENHERLWTPGNKLRVSEGRGVGEWGNQMMGSKEGTCVAQVIRGMMT